MTINKETVEKLLAQLDSKRASIWIEGPDPDAIGSAIGLQWLLKQYNCESDIWFRGVVSHNQNRTMVNVLAVTLRNYDEDDYVATDYEQAFCVDCTPKTLPEAIDVCIDHHPKNVSHADKCSLIDMRTTGSCGSVIYDWICLMNQTDNLVDEEGERVSSALLLAIFNDTDSLTSEDMKELDFTAYQNLHQKCDINKVKKVLAYPIPKYFLEAEAESIKPENTTLINTTYISCVGYISTSKRDVLAQLADKYARLEGVSTSIVFAVVGSNLEACFRSSDVSLDLHAFTQKILGKEYSGGKQGKAAGRVPLGFLASEGDDSETRDRVLDAVKAKMLTIIKKEVE